MIGTGLILAGKPVPLVAVSVARAGAAVAVRALRGTDYLVNEWQGPFGPDHDFFYISSGGGGPGESPTSTKTSRPPALHQQGQPVPVVVPAASISAHGGRRSGSKPRKQKCPEGHYWDHKRKKCRPMRDLIDWEAREAYRRDWYGYRRKG